MAACPQCSRPVEKEARYCASCGAALEAGGSAGNAPTSDDDATLLSEPPSTGSGPHWPASAPSSGDDDATLLSEPPSSGSASGGAARASAGSGLGSHSGRSAAISAAGLAGHTPSDALFSPGVLFARRYRIVGMLGKGGMGEVYRAEDIKLGQAVALKFLPRELADDPRRLSRFHDEVRLARQVTHPNVCRVHDIGEWEGLHFLSMEYIDGEDLSSLLRRIGRLPSDKAVQMARQLCAGLEAAHEQGVLHRDLKPANIMIDGRGRARITDFGLAALSHTLNVGEVAGTPAYMAPEQLRGEEVSVRSDIYSLGLVLYEIFTGRQTHGGAKTLDELKHLRSQDSHVSMSTHVADIDPEVESVILRCLRHHPEERPASALQVSAALPGGDPLQAALAAGETPSPEMLVAAQGSSLWTLRGTWLTAAGIALLAVLYVVVAQQVRLTERVGLPRPPEALADRAQELVAELGYSPNQADRAWAFSTDRAPLRWRASNLPLEERWEDMGGDPALQFWYRIASRPLKPLESDMRPSFDDPPLRGPGSVRLATDTQGRLLHLEALATGLDPLSRPESEAGVPQAQPVLGTDPPTGHAAAPDGQPAPGDGGSLGADPRERQKGGAQGSRSEGRGTAHQAGSPQDGESSYGPPSAAPPAQWRMLFQWAGLDPSLWRPAQAGFAPPSFADWRGVWRPAARDAAVQDAPTAASPVEVRMAALGGRVTYFRLIYPWTPGPEGVSPAPTLVGRIVSVLGLLLTPLIIALGLWMARRQLRQGKGDRRSAFRLAVIFLLVEMLRWFLTAHYLGSFSLQAGLLGGWLASRLLNAATLWLVYIALEPFARRYWPQALISWTKVLSRGPSDPLVARDLLAGTLMGVLVALSNASQPLLAKALHVAAPPPPANGIFALMGVRETIAAWLSGIPEAVLSAISGTFIFLLFRSFLKKQWLAALATIALYTLAGPGLAGGNLTLDLIFNVIEVAVIVFTLLRFGLLATVMAFVATSWLSYSPITLDFTAWHGGLSLAALTLLLATTAYCLWKAGALSPQPGR
ncbi:MAG TPA: protein kinase [Acidobacteriota bacterium]|nr:protein kinase [Acidobacteriota bacterium]